MKPGIGLIGRKLGMTQLFREDGRPVPVTVLAAGPCTVVQLKTVERDGYHSVQLGFEDVRPDRLTKPESGHFAKAKVSPKRVLRQFGLPASGAIGQAAKTPEQSGAAAGEQELSVGSTVTVELFKPGDRVDITGQSIGKGFQGGMKRWHWKGGPATHGSMSHRAPGSIGSSTNPSRVFKGHHLPGHMGDERVTTRALEVIKVDTAQHLLVIKGSVPGADQGVVFIRRSTKPPKLQVAQKPQAKKKAAQPSQAAKGSAPAKEKEKKKA